jgi:hypothetical protein
MSHELVFYSIIKRGRDLRGSIIILFRGSIIILLVFNEKLILALRVLLLVSLCDVVNLGDFSYLFFQVRFPLLRSGFLLWSLIQW